MGTCEAERMHDGTGGPHPDPRPRFHFTPPQGWLNDPNGLVFADGWYHLCYQHHPESDVWGPMHWGHAVSRDLLRWEHLPVALAPDELGWIYSGSAVRDPDGTGGFGAGALVAAFTHASAEGQVQSLASSIDGGRTWHTDPANPVLRPPEGTTDFRDPKVFRWSQGGEAHWVMVLAAGHRVELYTSPDLRHWTHQGGLRPRTGADTVFETPDLVPLRVDGSDERRWMLSIGVLSDGPTGGTGTGYLLGDFDGEVFTPDDDELRWADHGPDFYAAQSWNDPPSADPVWIAWMSNWAYADAVPSTGWRGVLTVPRHLGLTRTAGGLRLVQRPVAALDAQRAHRCSARQVVLSRHDDPLAGIRSRHFDLTTVVRVDQSTASRFELHLRVGGTERMVVSFDLAASTITVDRSRAGAAPFHGAHPRSAAAPITPHGGRVTLRVLGDECSVEVFANHGEASLSSLVYPDPHHDGLELHAIEGDVVVEALDLFDVLP